MEAGSNLNLREGVKSSTDMEAGPNLKLWEGVSQVLIWTQDETLSFGRGGQSSTDNVFVVGVFIMGHMWKT